MNSVRRQLSLWFFRLAAGGAVPARWFLPRVPAEAERAARRGPLSVEIVSHCWRYAHLLSYQLSSLALYPPSRVTVTMTVYFAEEDTETTALLRAFAEHTIPGVQWNWQPLEPRQLFRRSIGRNRAARASRCDWVWFTDCDTIFHRGCLDGLGDALQGKRDALVFPEVESCSPLLEADDPMLTPTPGERGLVDIDPSRFTPMRRGRATGPYQITHGDVARACGYCDDIAIFQEPAERWQKAHEDRVFRWLLRSEGVPIDVPGVYRIRHASKGRYQGPAISSGLRTAIRRIQDRLRTRRERDS